MKPAKEKRFKEVFVANVIKKINRGVLVDGFDVRKAVKIVLNGQVEGSKVFLGSLFSSLMHVNDTNVIKSAILGSLDLDKIMEKKVKVKEKIYSIGGSGKDDIKTFNVSSTASILVASMGLKIFKIGAPGTSNACGSKELFENIGVKKIQKISNIALTAKRTNFLYMPVDKIVPNLFDAYDANFYYPNVLSYGLLPLVTPVKLSGMVYGLAHPEIKISANILSDFGMRNFLIVCGMHKDRYFLDEISVTGNTKICHIDNNGKINDFVFNPKKIGILHTDFNDILEVKGGYDKSKKKALKILSGNGSKIENDLIAVNAGAILFLSKKSDSLKAGYQEAKKHLKNGTAMQYLNMII